MYLQLHIPASARTNREIAIACGFKHPQIIDGFRTGAIKVPVDVAPALAKVIGREPRELLAIVIHEYMPAAWEVMAEMCPALKSSFRGLQMVTPMMDRDSG